MVSECDDEDDSSLPEAARSIVISIREVVRISSVNLSKKVVDRALIWER